MELPSAAGDAEFIEQSAREVVQVNSIEIDESDVGEGGGEAAGLIELASARGNSFQTPAHGCTGIDKKANGQVLLLFVEFYEEAIEASVSGPIDTTEFITRCVVAIVGEFQARARLAAATLGALLAAKEPFRQQVKL